METWDAIRSRRNVRSYDDRPLPPDALDRILEAGRLTPSASNWQPWDFVVVDDKDQLAELATVWQGARHVAGSAATIVLVAPIPEEPRRRQIAQYDLGQATMQMMIAAADLGIGSGHSAIGDQERTRELLGIPGDHEPLYMIALGYPDDRPLAPAKLKRRPFDDVVHRGRF